MQYFGSRSTNHFDSQLRASVAGFVNMDSIPGTKPMLFEVTGSWMEQEFAKVVPRPLGNVAVRIELTRVKVSLIDCRVIVRALICSKTD